MESRDDDLDLPEFSRVSKSGQSSSMRLTLRPEAMPMDFQVRPNPKLIQMRLGPVLNRLCKISTV
ncbi:hypothetical protein LOK49_LG11G02053 [Camellia lanceoleosa]|uniref:Uncharacterized protein n=1 Tax=Camellia lanceoleosa TaxID=1840588 RepID=A0ACC0G4Q6_9ERIC|nr:hypothetical protein LOK49_LG11G02053 [Camellia lanceoleosa]